MRALGTHQNIAQVVDKIGEVIKHSLLHSRLFFIPVFPVCQIIRHVFAQQTHDVMPRYVDQSIVKAAGNDGFDDRGIRRYPGAGAAVGAIHMLRIVDQRDAASPDSRRAGSGGRSWRA